MAGNDTDRPITGHLLEPAPHERPRAHVLGFLLRPHDLGTRVAREHRCDLGSGHG